MGNPSVRESPIISLSNISPMRSQRLAAPSGMANAFHDHKPDIKRGACWNLGGGGGGGGGVEQNWSARGSLLVALLGPRPGASLPLIAISVLGEVFRR